MYVYSGHHYSSLVTLGQALWTLVWWLHDTTLQTRRKRTCRHHCINVYKKLGIKRNQSGPTWWRLLNFMAKRASRGTLKSYAGVSSISSFYYTRRVLTCSLLFKRRLDVFEGQQSNGNHTCGCLCNWWFILSADSVWYKIEEFNTELGGDK